MMKNIYKQYLLILVSLLILVCVWEFFLEDIFNALVFNEFEIESHDERLEYIFTVLIFCLLALMIPFYLTIKAEKKRIAARLEREKLIEEQQKALDLARLLRGFLPICAACKDIKDDNGNWIQLEAYISTHSEAEFSHGVCPDCAEKLYPNINFTHLE